MVPHTCDLAHTRRIQPGQFTPCLKIKKVSNGAQCKVLGFNAWHHRKRIKQQMKIEVNLKC